MTTYTETSLPHLQPADLQRALDGEGNAAERERNATHLATCAECAGRLDLLGRQAALVRSALTRAAFEGPRMAAPAVPAGELLRARSRVQHRATPVFTPWLRAAAIIVLLAIPVASSSTVREWMASWFAADVQTSAVPAQAPVSPPAPTVIRFAPSGSSFEVVFASTQLAGTLEIVTGTGSEATLEITGTAGRGPVIAASGVRINNDLGSNASYTLRLPPSVTRATVTVPSSEPVVLDAAALRTGARISVADPNMLNK